MAEPSYKNPVIAKFLDDLAGRSTAIRADRCVSAPIGCGGPATQFDNPLFVKEYTISGLCQKCQDRVFGKGVDEG
jgi:hypothetical protein